VKRPNSGGFYPANNLGYAGTRPLAREKAPGVLRIYCVGGSTGEQGSLEQSDGTDDWPAQVQLLCDQEFGAGAVEVINAGASGYTSAESLAEFMFRGTALAPDIMLIYHGVNDAWQVQLLQGFQSDYSHARLAKSFVLHWAYRLPDIRHLVGWTIVRWWLTTRIAKDNALIGRISNIPWESDLVYDPARVWAFERNSQLLIGAARQHDCEPIVIRWECDWDMTMVPQLYVNDDKQTLSRTFRQYIVANNDAMQRLAQKHTARFVVAGPFSSDCFYDGMHMTAKGLQHFAEAVFANLKPAIATRIEATRSGAARSAARSPSP
jgi:lysophospholipase L1-like esterase